MLTLHPSAERGQSDHGWLQSRHSFSFGGHQDPAHPGFGNLRVINEDRIEPGTGFAAHSHRDMEIISYVLSGELAHRDSIGNVGVIAPGDVQRLSAGRGVTHSEFNQAEGRRTHFLQIWLQPGVRGVEPGYEQKHFSDEEKRGVLRLLASPDGADDSIRMHADARLYAGLFDGGEAARMPLDATRKTYVHLVRGELDVNGSALKEGDAALLSGETELVLAHGGGAEVLVFDLAA